MGNNKEKIDTSILPDEGLKKLIDYYNLLVEHYLKKEKIDKKLSQDKTLPKEFYCPIKVKKYFKINREEIYQDV